MDVLVGTFHSFILDPDLLLVRTGVAQSMIAEVRFDSDELLQRFEFQHKMTDASNIGDAVAFEPLMWSIGSTIA